jgi:hypothetical protein
VGAVVVVIVALVLRGLSNGRANTCARCSTDEGALKPATEHRAKHRAARTANQRAFARTDTALLGLLVVPVIVVVGTVVVIVVIATLRAVTHTVVVGTIVMVLLRKGGNRCCRDENEERSDKDRIPELAHLYSDAGLGDKG